MREGSLLFMVVFQAIEHLMGGRKFLNEMEISGRDMALNESTKGGIVVLLDKMGFQQNDRIRARQGAI